MPFESGEGGRDSRALLNPIPCLCIIPFRALLCWMSRIGYDGALRTDEHLDLTLALKAARARMVVCSCVSVQVDEEEGCLVDPESSPRGMARVLRNWDLRDFVDERGVRFRIDGLGRLAISAPEVEQLDVTNTRETEHIVRRVLRIYNDHNPGAPADEVLPVTNARPSRCSAA